jgi:enoyl-CoA hydratase/carnithine racemase
MAASLDLRREGQVFVLTMQSGENRFNQTFVDAFNQALDTVEASSGPAALVTIGTEKFYSNGLDLDWMAGEGAGGDFLASVLRLLGRVLGFPLPTVAAINVHAFAAGAMLALAHDFRVMRADRGYFCLPEVDINLPLAPGMTALIACRLTPAVLRDLVLTGARLGGQEAKQRGIVDEAVSLDALLPWATARAEQVAGKQRPIYAALKRGMYREALELLASAAPP